VRAFYHYLALLAGLTACDSGLEIEPASVQWMEWPAEVSVATPFTARMLVPFPACHRSVFKPAVSENQSAVTFAPYFLVEGGAPVCLPSPALDVAPVPFLALDTVITAPGLATTVARTFEMRATAFVATSTTNTNAVRTFGDVTVRLSNPDTSRRNAGGVATLLLDGGGCARLRPAGYLQPPQGYVLEDQADTTGLNYAFVRGYLHEAAAPVCGQTRVFKLVSRN